jgi:hypothetical protein
MTELVADAHPETSREPAPQLAALEMSHGPNFARPIQIAAEIGLTDPLEVT